MVDFSWDRKENGTKKYSLPTQERRFSPPFCRSRTELFNLRGIPPCEPLEIPPCHSSLTRENLTILFTPGSLSYPLSDILVLENPHGNSTKLHCLYRNIVLMFFKASVGWKYCHSIANLSVKFIG